MALLNGSPCSHVVLSETSPRVRCEIEIDGRQQAPTTSRVRTNQSLLSTAQMLGRCLNAKIRRDSSSTPFAFLLTCVAPSLIGHAMPSIH